MKNICLSRETTNLTLLPSTKNFSIQFHAHFSFLCTCHVIEAFCSKYGWKRNLEEKEVTEKIAKKKEKEFCDCAALLNLRFACELHQGFSVRIYPEKKSGKKPRLFCTFTMSASSVKTVVAIYFFSQICYSAFTFCEAKPINWKTAGNI